ncbi:RNA-directed DNA polymerase, eukaryota [Tanacetum coccineum]
MPRILIPLRPILGVLQVRSALDDHFLPSADVATRWVKFVPIKVNIFAWRARLSRLPTRGNLLARGVSLDSSLCPICNELQEDSDHLFFSCDLGKCTLQNICRWWNLQWEEVSSFVDWYSWFSSIRLPIKLKTILEGVFYTPWWHIWSFQNRLIFDSSPPKRYVLFDDIVSSSFTWYYHNITSNTLVALEAMTTLNVNTLIYSSTCATYGEPEKTPITEEILQPLNFLYLRITKASKREIDVLKAEAQEIGSVPLQVVEPLAYRRLNDVNLSLSGRGITPGFVNVGGLAVVSSLLKKLGLNTTETGK